MASNNESQKLFSLLSNETETSPKINIDNCSLFNKKELTRSFNLHTTVGSSASVFSEVTYSSSNKLQNESDSLSESNVFQTFKSPIYSNETLLNSSNGNPLDYSINSLINNKKYSELSIDKSCFQLQSNYKHNSVQCLNGNNNFCDTSLSTCTTEYNINSVNVLKSFEMNDGRMLKRKYAKALSNSSEKDSKKYLKVESNNDFKKNNPIINHCHKNNFSNKVSQFSITGNLLNESLLLSKNVTYNNSSIVKWKTNKDADCEVYNREVIDTVNANITTQSDDQLLMFNEGYNKCSVNNCNNSNNTKITTNSTGAYKYLTWREKDRRRRFREEWKHLWLVVPYGLYEVMCLVCHKVMTQRKLDTIKRHNVRRHVELQGMSHTERKMLFDKLLKQHNIDDKSYATKPKQSYKSTSDGTSSVHDSNELRHKFLHDTNWLANQSSEINNDLNTINSSSSVHSSIPRYIQRKRNKRLPNKSNKNSYTTAEPRENVTNKGSEIFLKQLEKCITTANLCCCPSSCSGNLSETGNLQVSTKPSQRWVNYFNSLDVTTFGNQLKMAHDKTPLTSVLLSEASTIQPVPLVSTSLTSNYCSTSSPAQSSPVSPCNYDLEGLKHLVKSFVPSVLSSSPSLLSPTKSSSLLIPECCKTMYNSNNFITTNLCDGSACVNGRNDIYITDMIIPTNKGNQDIQPDIRKEAVFDEYKKIMSDQSLETLLNKKLTTQGHTSNNVDKDTSSKLSLAEQSNSLNVSGQSQYLRTSTSHKPSVSTPCITDLSPYVIASWLAASVNASKLSNYKMLDGLSSNLYKPIDNIQPNDNSNELLAIKQISRNSEPKEKFVYAKFVKDHLKCQHQENNQLATNSIDLKPTSKSKSNLNKFTISSLLNTEILDTTNTTLETADKNNSNSTILSEQQLLSRDNCIRSLFRSSHKEESTQFMPSAEYLS
ncbi:hypothetical protein EWB00_006481 [Schistosoma japonicum]|uniref:SPIN-DOC-like zinc-finger domain-containing protein n=1 Tax=Schistosoma japonicum TaxID=6182 RepID=A0A4Z2CY16_SCHJA|nr:hypothetical protein EWB00_006481 [Schistosoma japonicum]